MSEEARHAFFPTCSEHMVIIAAIPTCEPILLPPTQRTGLLVSPTAFSKDERTDRQEAPRPRASLRPQKEKRSVDQGANLKDSFRRMLDALNGPVRNSATA